MNEIETKAKDSYRTMLINQYYGYPSLEEKLKAESVNTPDGIVLILLSESMKETDALLSTRLIAEQNGDLRTTINASSKRIESLIKVIEETRKLKEEAKEEKEVSSNSNVQLFLELLTKSIELVGLTETQNKALLNAVVQGLARMDTDRASIAQNG